MTSGQKSGDMSARLSRHFLRRAQHALAADLVASSIENGLLSAHAFDFRGTSCLKFSLSPPAAAKPTEILVAEIANFEQLGLGLGQRHRFIYEQGEIVVDIDFSPTPIKYSGSKEISVRTSQSKSGSAAPNTSVQDLRLFAQIRGQLVKLPAGDVATLLLLAEGVGDRALSLRDISHALRKPRSVTTIFCGADGFEVRFLDLLKRGLILPGESVVTLVGENSTRSEVRQASKRRVRRHIVTVFGSLYGADTHDRGLALAAQGALPLLCVSEFKSGIPKALRATADLSISCPALSADVIGQTIEIVTGSRPTASLSDLNLDFVGLDDLSFAIGPGSAADEAVRKLVALAANREASLPSRKPAKEKPSTIDADVKMPVPSTIDAVTVETLHGYPKSLVAWAEDLKLDLGLWANSQLPWDDVGASLLLSGRPGTGKTIFADALSNSLSVPLIRTSVATWLQPSYLGSVLARMKDTFSEAGAAAPAVLFIDEIDAIGVRGGGGKEYSDYWIAVVNCLLELLNPSLRRPGLIVVGATNRPEHVDAALRRAGRLHPHIQIPSPDQRALMGIFRHHLGTDLKGVAATAPCSL